MHDRHSPQQARVSYTGGSQLMPLSTLDRSLLDPVIRRLNVLRSLSAEARTSLEYAMLEGIQRAGAGEDLISEGDPDVKIDGIPVAFEGHKTSCGAVLISTMPTSGRA